MTYNPGGAGSGSGAIATASDAALSNKADRQVLQYNATTGKWTNHTVVPSDIVGLAGFVDDLIANSTPGNGTTMPWSDTNPPWKLAAGESLTDNWPSDATAMIVPLSTSGATFRDQLNNTLSAAGGPCIIQLPAGTYHFSAFYSAATGTQTSTTTGFGYMAAANLRGFLGAGADKTFIVMDPNSYTQAQIDAIRQLSASSTGGSVGFRIIHFAQGVYSSNGPTGNALYLSGITFRGSDQQTIQGSDFATPNLTTQPAPYNGITIRGAGVGSLIQYCRFQGCGETALTGPPYEMSNIGTQYSSITWRRIESDGRLAAEVDPTQPRRTGIIMMNNEFLADIRDSWFHDGLLTRYAVNDGNQPTTGTYTHDNVTLERIGDVTATDTNVSRVPVGYENFGGTCVWKSSNLSVVGANWTKAHIQFSTVNGQSYSNPAHGQLTVTDGTFSHGHPVANGYFMVYVPNTSNWWTGSVNTLPVTVKKGSATLTPYKLTSEPTTQSLSSAGVSTNTHYFVLSN